MKKLYRFKRYCILKFAKVLNIVTKWPEIQNSDCRIFWTDKAFSIIFSYLNSSHHILLKSRNKSVIRWKQNFDVICMTSFSRQKPLKSKNKNHTIVCNSEVCYVAKFELHWIKNTKVIPRVPLQASCWPGVYNRLQIFAISTALRRLFCYSFPHFIGIV